MHHASKTNTRIQTDVAFCGDTQLLADAATCVDSKAVYEAEANTEERPDRAVKENDNY